MDYLRTLKIISIKYIPKDQVTTYTNVCLNHFAAGYRSHQYPTPTLYRTRSTKQKERHLGKEDYLELPVQYLQKEFEMWRDGSDMLNENIYKQPFAPNAVLLSHFATIVLKWMWQ